MSPRVDNSSAAPAPMGPVASANARGKPRGFSNSTGAPTKRCPTCERDVTLRKDGSMRSHKVGNLQRGGWTCPGTDEGVYG